MKQKESKHHMWTLTKRQFYDVTCLLNNAFQPLTGFLNQADYLSVCETMRLSDGTLWPMPITLDVSEGFALQCSLGDTVSLLDEDNTPIAVLTLDAIWQPNKTNEARQVFGTTDRLHPGVQYLYDEAGAWYLGGELKALSEPKYYDFLQYRHTPDTLKQLFKFYGWSRVIAFQTRNPMHRAHFALTKRAAKSVNANLLLHPVVGMTKSGDIDYVHRVKCYLQVLKYYQAPVMLSLLPLAMRMGGPREALWHAIIRKNYGATHFIVGRDHAGPGLDAQNQAFYSPYAAQDLLIKYQDEIGIEMVASPEIVYVKEKNAYLTREEMDAGDTVEAISGTAFRKALRDQKALPAWFSFPEVVQILRQAQGMQGITIFFTGLSGAGKSTLAKALMARLLEQTERKVSLLDGDVVRKALSKGLGFSKADRDTHITRLGYVAAEITKHGGIAIIAAIAPFTEIREAVREVVTAQGTFVEVHVSTPLKVCVSRDVKGLYQKAKMGKIQGLTGLDAPYEEPSEPECVIDTSKLSVQDAVDCIWQVLQVKGLDYHVERQHAYL
jgi:sulfate adenylyltransferase